MDNKNAVIVIVIAVLAIGGIIAMGVHFIGGSAHSDAPVETPGKVIQGSTSGQLPMNGQPTAPP
jgi:hypothetical protein